MEATGTTATAGRGDWLALIDMAALRERLARQMPAARADAVVQDLERMRDAEALRPLNHRPADLR